MGGSGEAPQTPLYTLTEGSRKAYKAGSATGNNGDVKVTNGNHFYFYKRWGDNQNTYFARLKYGDPPDFTLSAGDEIRTVLRFKPGASTGTGLRIVVGTYLGEVATVTNYNTTLISANPQNVDSAENVVVLSKSYPATDNRLEILARPEADTSQKKWEADLEIYVNGVRYI